MAKKNAPNYRKQASVEAEVARARLAKAHRHAERGEVLRAMEDTVETAFDAGMVHCYSMLSGEKQYRTTAHDILGQSQTLGRALVADAAHTYEPKVANPRRPDYDAFKQVSEKAVVRAGGAETYEEALNEAMNAAFGAGGAYVTAKSDSERQYVLRLYHETVKLIQRLAHQEGARAANPAPTPRPAARSTQDFRAIRAKLLR